MTIPVGPPVMAAVVGGPSAFLATAQREGRGPGQWGVNPKKKKWVRPATLGFKNSVHPVQRAVVEVSNCAEKVGVVFITNFPPCSVNPPNAYCQGVLSAAPVPHRRTVPVVGSLK